MFEPRGADAWWLQPLASQLDELGASTGGLSEEQAQERVSRLGRNLFAERPRHPVWLQFLARFRNPLVLVLLAASAISGLTGDATSALIISAVLVLSVVLDFAQEYRAGRAAERLKESVAVHATVVRAGKPYEIPVADVVPGDVVLVSAGDLIPADGRVLEARDLFVWVVIAANLLGDGLRDRLDPKGPR